MENTLPILMGAGVNACIKIKIKIKGQARGQRKELWELCQQDTVEVEVISGKEENEEDGPCFQKDQAIQESTL